MSETIPGDMSFLVLNISTESVCMFLLSMKTDPSFSNGCLNEEVLSLLEAVAERCSVKKGVLRIYFPLISYNGMAQAKAFDFAFP